MSFDEASHSYGSSSHLTSSDYSSDYPSSDIAHDSSSHYSNYDYSSHNTPHSASYFPLEPPQAALLVANLTAALALGLILGRTYLYVSRRRSGLVGPAMAFVLLKVWSLYGVIEFISQLFVIYLTPFRVAWIVSFPRALFLLFLACGRTLSFPQFMYERRLVPFYDTHSNRIEQYLHDARGQWREVNQSLQQLSNVLLKRIAVGGLTNVVQLPTAAELRQPAVAQSDTSADSVSMSTLSSQDRPFDTARRFYAGDPEPRAEAVISSRTDHVGASAQSAMLTQPKAVFDNARAMRMKFRRRSTGTNLTRTTSHKSEQ